MPSAAAGNLENPPGDRVAMSIIKIIDIAMQQG